MAERGTAQPSGSGDASRVVEKAEPSSTRISSLDDSQSSSTSAKVCVFSLSSDISTAKCGQALQSPASHQWSGGCFNVPRPLQAEDFLEHVSRAVVAELDGALCDMQLLFGVNTVARAEFQRILQELLHWGPLVEVRRSFHAYFLMIRSGASRPVIAACRVTGPASPEHSAKGNKFDQQTSDAGNVQVP